MIGRSLGSLGGKLVAKPSDGRKRVSFVEADENGDDDAYDDAENDETPHSKRDVLNSIRLSSQTINLTEDEVDRIFDDVFATPQERERQVTLAEISAKHDYFGNGPMKDIRYATRTFKRYPSTTIVRAVVAVLVLILIGWASWEIGRGQAPTINDGAEPNGSIATNQTNDNDRNPLGDEAAAAVMTNAPQFPVVNVDAEKVFSRNGDVSEPHAVPGKDIGTYLIGFVEEPVDPAEIEILLKHDLTKDLRVTGNNEVAKLDTSETVRVKVNDYDLQCGVKVDQVPLTLICSFNELCGVYFVGASYCDKYE